MLVAYYYYIMLYFLYMIYYLLSSYEGLENLIIHFCQYSVIPRLPHYPTPYILKNSIESYISQQDVSLFSSHFCSL